MKPMMKCGHVANSVLRMKDGVDLPACVICAPTIESKTIDTNFTLEGRMATCYCGRDPRHSDPNNLAFFEYRGPGSPWAVEHCKCGYFKSVHDPSHENHNRLKCKNFVERGPHEYDNYYCGCRGWD